MDRTPGTSPWHVQGRVCKLGTASLRRVRMAEFKPTTCSSSRHDLVLPVQYTIPRLVWFAVCSSFSLMCLFYFRSAPLSLGSYIEV